MLPLFALLNAHPALIMELTGFFTVLGAGIAFTWREIRRARSMRNRREARSEAMLASLSAIDARIHTLQSDVTDVKKEVRDNGGNSLKDAVVALNHRVGLEAAARRIGESKAIWEGVVGLNGEVNPAHVSPEWERLTGLSCEATANGGWIRCVDPIQRDYVSNVVKAACDNRRLFEVDYRALNVLTGTKTYVRATGWPVWDVKHHVIGWVAILVPLPDTPSNVVTL